MFHRAIDGLAKGHAELVAAEEDARLFVQQHDAAFGMIGNLVYRQVAPFQRDHISVVYDLRRVIPWKRDPLKAGVGIRRQRHGFLRHVNQVKLAVQGGVVEVMVRVGGALHVVAQQVRAILTDIARAVAGVDE